MVPFRLALFRHKLDHQTQQAIYEVRRFHPVTRMFPLKTMSLFVSCWIQYWAYKDS